MRSEKEMFDLLISTAREDENILERPVRSCGPQLSRSRELEVGRRRPGWEASYEIRGAGYSDE